MFIVIPRVRVTRPAHRAQPVPQGPFAFTPAPPDGETALFFDRRVGFSHALPQWPQPMAVVPAPGEPVWDAAMQFWDLPAWLRYRLDRPAVYARSTGELAMMHASTTAAQRAGRAVQAEHARPERLAAWMVEAGAHAKYELAHPDPHGADVEEMTVLVRAGHVMTVALRYPKAALDWVRLAAFRAAIEATILWEPTHGHALRRIWPESTWLEAMATPVLKAARQPSVAALAPQFAVPQAERDALSALFQTMIASPLPPWSPVGPAERAWHLDALTRTTTSAWLHHSFHQALSDVWSIHDLRGFALMSGMAMQPRG